MKLYIDDIRNPKDDTWHICRNVLSAIRALDMFYKQVTEINLDHDISHPVSLGGMIRPYPCEETFETVARYIALLHKLDPEWNPSITIHTSNPVGADRMQGLLQGMLVAIKLTGGANRLETIL